MDDHAARPSWLDHPCPSWCVVHHREDDHPEDRHHDGPATYVPVILGLAAPPHRTRPVITDLLVLRSRRHDEQEEWLYVGEPDRARQHLLLSPESARRIARAIDDLTDP